MGDIPKLRRQHLLHLLAYGLLACGTQVWANTHLSEAEVKAGFIYNFTKFITWPASNDAHTLRICSQGNSPLAGKLHLLEGRATQGRTIQIDTATTDWRNCHVLYFEATAPATISATLTQLAQAPVLTISDQPDFIQLGGMIGLTTVADHVRFSINLGALQQAGLQVGSQLLTLAQKVIP